MVIVAYATSNPMLTVKRPERSAARCHHSRSELLQKVLRSAGTQSQVAVLYLAVFSSVAAYACWYWAIGVAGVARIAPIQFLQPVASLVLAVALLSEPITWPVVVALVAIVAGLVIGRREKKGTDLFFQITGWTRRRGGKNRSVPFKLHDAKVMALRGAQH